MREAIIRQRLEETRAELDRIEVEYRVLLDLTRDYERWLTVLGLTIEPPVTMEVQPPTLEPPTMEPSTPPAAVAEQVPSQAVALAAAAEPWFIDRLVAETPTEPAEPDVAAVEAWSEPEPAQPEPAQQPAFEAPQRPEPRAWVATQWPEGSGWVAETPTEPAEPEAAAVETWSEPAEREPAQQPAAELEPPVTTAPEWPERDLRDLPVARTPLPPADPWQMDEPEGQPPSERSEPETPADEALIEPAGSEAPAAEAPRESPDPLAEDPWGYRAAAVHVSRAPGERSDAPQWVRPGPHRYRVAALFAILGMLMRRRA